MKKFGLGLVLLFFIACGGSDKKVEGPLDGPNIACDCEMDPNCKTVSCAEEPQPVSPEKPQPVPEKPGADACKAALDNALAILRVDDVAAAEMRRAVRSCQSDSTMEEVNCIVNAKTSKDLGKCEASRCERGPCAEKADEPTTNSVGCDSGDPLCSSLPSDVDAAGKPDSP